MAEGLNTNMFVAAIKKINPAVTDQELGTALSKIKQAPPAEQQGWMDYLISQAKSVPTQLKDPYAGTDMAKRNPQNPASAQVGQFDPAQVAAAYDEYSKRYAATAPRRGMGQQLAAMAGPTALDSSMKSWAATDAENAKQTLERQKALQDAATQGLAAAASAQTKDKVAGEFALGQNKGIQDLMQGGIKSFSDALDVNQKAALATPGTRQAKLAFLQLKEQAAATGKPLPSGINGDTYSVLDMMPYMEPKLLEAWKSASAGRTASATADIDQAVAGSMVTKPGTTPVMPPPPAAQGAQPGARIDTGVQGARDRDALKIIQAEYNKLPDGHPDKPALLREMMRKVEVLSGAPVRNETPSTPIPAPQQTGPQLSASANERLKFSPITGAGQTLQPLPADVAEENADIGRRIEKGTLVENWNTFGKTSVARIRELLNKGAYAGKGNVALTAVLPNMTEQQLLLSELARLNSISPNLFPPALAASLKASIEKGGFSGGMLPSMSKDALEAMLRNLEQDMANQISAEQARTAPGAPAVRPSAQPLTPQAQAATSSQPSNAAVTISTQEEYNRLPAGTMFSWKGAAPVKKGGK